VIVHQCLNGCLCRCCITAFLWMMAWQICFVCSCCHFLTGKEYVHFHCCCCSSWEGKVARSWFTQRWRWCWIRRIHKNVSSDHNCARVVRWRDTLELFGQLTEMLTVFWLGKFVKCMSSVVSTVWYCSFGLNYVWTLWSDWSPWSPAFSVKRCNSWILCEWAVIIFRPAPLVRAGGVIFWGYPSMHAFWESLLAQYLINHLGEFCQIY